MEVVFFTSIRKSAHYRHNHEAKFPWPEVVEIILKTKNPRRKADLIEIKVPKAYILCRIRQHELVVLNAKRR